MQHSTKISADLQKAKEVIERHEAIEKALKIKCNNLTNDILYVYFKVFPANAPLVGHFRSIIDLMKNFKTERAVSRGWDFANGGYLNHINHAARNILYKIGEWDGNEHGIIEDSIDDLGRESLAFIDELSEINGLLTDPENRELYKRIYSFIETNIAA